MLESCRQKERQNRLDLDLAWEPDLDLNWTRGAVLAFDPVGPMK